MIQRSARVVAALFTLLGASCYDAPSAPQAGTLRASVTTTGGDLDADGYELVLGSKVKQLSPVNGTLDIANVGAGTYPVALESVADNCEVRTTSPRSVTITAGQISDVGFSVECAATGIAITTHATGANIPSSYQLVLNDQPLYKVAVNNTTVVSRLKSGSYTVALILPDDNCNVVGSSRVTVDVAARAVAPVLFEIACIPAVRREKIAFVTDTVIDGSTTTWIAAVNPDGSGRVNLAPGNAPAWSPDGSKLAFSDARCVTTYYSADYCSGSLLLIDPETRNVTRLSAGIAGTGPDWSRTSNTIAYWREPGELFVLAPEATVAKMLVVRGAAKDPTWSPDGQRIAFVCLVTGFSYDLCSVDNTGSDFMLLTTNGDVGSNPAWSPDGKRIAFTTKSWIALLTLAGGDIERLTPGFDAAWSPDGAKLIFADGDGLFTISADGSNRMRLTSGHHTAPAWRP